jgi:hypothetical protein
MKLFSRRPSPAMAVAFIALLAALSGTAVALPGKNTVDSGDLKKNAVKPKDIANGAVTRPKIRNGAVNSQKVGNDSLTGADINESSLGQVPTANTANSANTATTANNATNLGGKPPSAYATSTSEAYHEVGAAGEPAFENGWTNLNAGFSTAAFFIDSEGLVHLKGTLTAAAGGSVAFTLPEGYRPSKNLFLPMAAIGPVAGNLIINSTGGVVPTCETAGCLAGIDGLIFRAGAG